MESKERIRELLAQANALLSAMRYSIDSARTDDVWKYGSYKTFLRKYSSLLNEATPLLKDVTQLDGIDLSKIKSNMNTVALEQKELFDLAYSNTAILKSLLEGEIGYAEDQTHNLADFIQSNLRKAIFDVPAAEVEVQNAIETLFVGRGMVKGLDYDRETGRVKTSGKESIPDFLLSNLQLCLEVKLAKSAERIKPLIDEINADIRAFGTRYDRQLYVVYDVGTIRDAEEFKRDLESAPGVTVIIVKH
jgi:hypothetical protein